MAHALTTEASVNGGEVPADGSSALTRTSEDFSCFFNPDLAWDCGHYLGGTFSKMRAICVVSPKWTSGKPA